MACHASLHNACLTISASGQGREMQTQGAQLKMCGQTKKLCRSDQLVYFYYFNAMKKQGVNKSLKSDWNRTERLFFWTPFK